MLSPLRHFFMSTKIGYLYDEQSSEIWSYVPKNTLNCLIIHEMFEYCVWFKLKKSTEFYSHYYSFLFNQIFFVSTYFEVFYQKSCSIAFYTHTIFLLLLLFLCFFAKCARSLNVTQSEYYSAKYIQSMYKVEKRPRQSTVTLTWFSNQISNLSVHFDYKKKMKNKEKVSNFFHLSIDQSAAAHL